MVGVWLGDDPRTNAMKIKYMLKTFGLHLQFLLTTPQCSEHNIECIYIFIVRINKHALSITITKSWNVQFPTPILAHASS